MNCHPCQPLLLPNHRGLPPLLHIPCCCPYCLRLQHFSELVDQAFHSALPPLQLLDLSLPVSGGMGRESARLICSCLISVSLWTGGWWLQSALWCTCVSSNSDLDLPKEAVKQGPQCESSLAKQLRDMGGKTVMKIHDLLCQCPYITQHTACHCRPLSLPVAAQQCSHANCPCMQKQPHLRARSYSARCFLS